MAKGANIKKITSDYQVIKTDDFVQVDTTSQAVIVTLPEISSVATLDSTYWDSRIYKISGGNQLSIITSGLDQIKGASSLILDEENSVLEIVAMYGENERQVGGSFGSGTISPEATTAQDVIDQVALGTLTPGQWYRIPDYQTIYVQVSTGIIKTGDPEDIIVKAQTNQVLDPIGYSVTYDDTIYYDPTFTEVAGQLVSAEADQTNGVIDTDYSTTYSIVSFIAPNIMRFDTNGAELDFNNTEGMYVENYITGEFWDIYDGVTTLQDRITAGEVTVTETAPSSGIYDFNITGFLSNLGNDGSTIDYFNGDQRYVGFYAKTAPTPAKGVIYRRIDAKRNVDISFDYYAVEFPSWRCTTTGGYSTGLVGYFLTSPSDFILTSNSAVNGEPDKTVTLVYDLGTYQENKLCSNLSTMRNVKILDLGNTTLRWGRNNVIFGSISNLEFVGQNKFTNNRFNSIASSGYGFAMGQCKGGNISSFTGTGVIFNSGFGTQAFNYRILGEVFNHYTARFTGDVYFLEGRYDNTLINRNAAGAANNRYITFSGVINDFVIEADEIKSRMNTISGNINRMQVIHVGVGRDIEGFSYDNPGFTEDLLIRTNALAGTMDIKMRLAEDLNTVSIENVTTGKAYIRDFVTGNFGYGGSTNGAFTFTALS